ncbi:MAG: hypothetical protein C0483_13940 [Pirellula sp.]|nr:hypothetical protein [Pirellula sp.]
MPVIGTRQSPIHLVAEQALPLADPAALMTIRYGARESFTGRFAKLETDHPILAIDDPGRASVRFRDIDWKLLQVHIHTESEHVVGNDDPHDFEIHLVHVPYIAAESERADKKRKDKKGTHAGCAGPNCQTLVYPEAPPKLVIGILYRLLEARESTGETTGGLRQLAAQLSPKPAPAAGKKGKPADAADEDCGHGDHVPPESVNIAPYHFFPMLEPKKADLVNWYHYEGSLTGPPYSEDVSWFVMRDPARISEGTLECLDLFAAQHARELQAIDRRLVVRSFS